MFFIDEWYDVVRWLNLLMSAGGVVILIVRFKRNGQSYNIKTKDYWYALLMWCIAGVALSLTGLIKHAPFTVVPVFTFAASAVTFKGLTRKGAWGSKDA